MTGALPTCPTCNTAFTTPEEMNRHVAAGCPNSPAKTGRRKPTRGQR